MIEIVAVALGALSLLSKNRVLHFTLDAIIAIIGLVLLVSGGALFGVLLIALGSGLAVMDNKRLPRKAVTEQPPPPDVK